MPFPCSPELVQASLDAVAEHGSIRAASKALGIPYTTLHDRVHGGRQGTARAVHIRQERAERAQAQTEDQIVKGRLRPPERQEWPIPQVGGVYRYIFTCAQNNTALHDGLWTNLKALAAHYGARLCVSTFTYDLASYGKASVKRGKAKGEKSDEPWWAPEVMQHILDEPVVVAPGLVWCGEMNILPSAVRPLSGLESYTGRKSGIFPHVKFAMESIASGKNEGTKFNYTTGTVTQRNYIQKKAGIKAEFHHGYGALLVEVDDAGTWFVRQLNADSEGTLYDLDIRVQDGVVEKGHWTQAINWGDIHEQSLELEMRKMCWGEGGILDTLRPAYQFCHDVLDFRSRNHHDTRDPHKIFAKYVEGADDVVDEVRGVGRFLGHEAYRDWCETIVVDSNHDNALARWLREADFRADPKNSLFFLEAELEVRKAILHGEGSFHLLEWAVNRDLNRNGVARFLRPDESFVICHDANGGIECGMHGDKGPNGTRGTPMAFAKMGRKSNIGDKHSAGIYDGCYVAGITGALDQGYNGGPSSWSQSHIVTYKNGKRTIVTCWNGKWRA